MKRILKKLYNFFVTCFYNLVFPFVLQLVNSNVFRTKKYTISLCAIFKDEAPFLKEWIEFHKIVGVEHFYLYNNDSSDDFREVIQPYIELGIVTIIEWPYPQAQMKAYKHFYENFRDETSWVSFLDIDEFFCPKYADTLEEWLESYKKYPVVLIYWMMFGTSGKLQHDYDSLVIEQYNISWDYLYHVGKCLINTNYDIVSLDNAAVHHSPWVKVTLGPINFKIPPVNQFGYFVPKDLFWGPTKELEKSTIQINHYWSKAWNIYDNKRKKSDVFFKENPKKKLDYFYFHERENRTSNRMIYRFLMKLKLSLNEID